MKDLSKDEIVRLARRVCHPSRQEVFLQYRVELEHFATLCRADLVAENEKYKKSQLVRMWDELEAERDALKADAERYREALETISGTTDGTDCNEVAREAMKRGEA